MDVMRLSIIVRNNLEKEAEAKEYDAASSAGAPKGDVKLNHTDAELDFEEQAADSAGLLFLTCFAVTTVLCRHVLVQPCCLDW